MLGHSWADDFVTGGLLVLHGKNSILPACFHYLIDRFELCFEGRWEKERTQIKSWARTRTRTKNHVSGLRDSDDIWHARYDYDMIIQQATIVIGRIVLRMVRWCQRSHLMPVDRIVKVEVFDLSRLLSLCELTPNARHCM